jgi:ornithine cyclodeaminase
MPFVRNSRTLLVLSAGDVARLLDPDRLVDALATGMAELSAGQAKMAPRVAVQVEPGGGFLAAMVAHLPSAAVLSTKLVAVYPANTARGLPSHLATIQVFDPDTGMPLAIMDGGEITAARTAAGSALATRLLAREDAAVLAVLGTGVQAEAHARAVSRVRPIREVRIAGRDAAKARALAALLDGTIPGAAVQASPDFGAACRGADIVCTTTHAAEPVVRRELLAPGMHVNAVGFNGAGREVDAETVRDSTVVVELREAALAPFPVGANELLWPIRDGVIPADHVRAEIGEVVAGTRPGRTSPHEITLYKSVGVAVQDAVAAGLVLAAAREKGVGQEVAF